MQKEKPGKPLILFDGVCNLCNRSVQFIIRHDPSAKFQFGTLQSQKANALLSLYEMNEQGLNSIVLLQDGQLYTRSTAALKIARQLTGPVKLLYACIIVPAFIRDAVYKLVARKRYQWFGKRDTCMMPSPELSERFITD